MSPSATSFLDGIPQSLKETMLDIMSSHPDSTKKTESSMRPLSASALRKAYAHAETHYISSNPKSLAHYNTATHSLPGGNTRSVLFYPPFPLTTTSAKGCSLTDADGHHYIDFLGEYTAGLYGHSEPIIHTAIQTALSQGLSFGSHHANEAQLATLIKARFPSVSLLRFTNSGTEATLMALAVAKVFTQKEKIIVFSGAYHGGTFSFAHGQSSPVNVPHEYLIAQYNDIASVDKLIDDNADNIAAIVVEPMLGSAGAIPATPVFLSHLRTRATFISALLIFDEVMTSRLYSGGGIQSELSIDPDLTTLGKYIGGGLSFGAFGGRQEIMELFDPRAPEGLKHAGTFNNNVLTMAAGVAGLEHVFTRDVARALHTRGEDLRQKLNAAANGTLLKITGCGSIMTLHFTTTPLEGISKPDDLGADGDEEMKDLGALLHLFLLDKGIYIARRGFVALSLAIGESECARFVSTIEMFLEEFKELVRR